ncbi:hypothetical protein L6R46_19945, partial [Myxococcota bacterium]|nr:hypothetical protein [Myxococcota bacterium]
MPKSRATQQEHVNDAPAHQQGPVNLNNLGQDLQNTMGNAAVAAQTGVNGGREDISRYTPEYVEANRDALGIPPGAPIDDFFLEFVAHNLVREQLSKTQNLTKGDANYERVKAQHKLLESWGYNPEVTADQEVIDPTTGLYGVRLDPSEAGAAQGKGSIMAFRATEPFTPHEMTLENPHGDSNDLITDFGPSVGSRQYDPNSERIRELMAGGQGDMTLAGFSLGGYLAQRAAADNADLIGNGEVVTYQAGGLHREDTAKFNQANADGHIDVRHHQTNMDIMHRAGEAPLPGTFFEHTPNGIAQGHTRTLMYDDNDTKTIAEVTGGKTTQEYSEDPNGGFQRHYWEGLRNIVGGAVRLHYSGNNAALQTGIGLGKGIVNVGNGLVESGQSAWNGLSSGANTAGEGLGTGFEQFKSGDYLQGLGTMGGGLLQGTGQALTGLGQGALGLGETAIGAVGDTAGALYDGASTLMTDAAMGAYQVGRGAMNLVEGGTEQMRETAIQATADAIWAGHKTVEGAKWAGNKAAEGAKW